MGYHHYWILSFLVESKSDIKVRRGKSNEGTNGLINLKDLEQIIKDATIRGNRKKKKKTHLWQNNKKGIVTKDK